MRTPPKITYPASLPISERVDEIAAARERQVRVVPGVPGLKRTTYGVTYKNGVETARTVTSAAVVRQPVASRREEQ